MFMGGGFGGGNVKFSSGGRGGGGGFPFGGFGGGGFGDFWKTIQNFIN